jgi:hypothetical protein
MTRHIALFTIIDGEVSRLWPRFDGEADESLFCGAEHSEALDDIARDWCFSFDSRDFKVSGCGMDMVFWLVDYLAHKALGDRRYTHRAKRKHESEAYEYSRPMDYVNHVSRTAL